MNQPKPQEETMVSSTTGIELGSFEVDRASGTYRAGYEPAITPPSMAVIGFLARICDCCPLEMDALQSTVDTDALNRIVAAAEGTTAAVDVSFTYENYEITVRRTEVVATEGLGSDESRNEATLGSVEGTDHGVDHEGDSR